VLFLLTDMAAWFVQRYRRFLQTMCTITRCGNLVHTWYRSCSQMREPRHSQIVSGDVSMNGPFYSLKTSCNAGVASGAGMVAYCTDRRVRLSC